MIKNKLEPYYKNIAEIINEVEFTDETRLEKILAMAISPSKEQIALYNERGYITAQAGGDCNRNLFGIFYWNVHTLKGLEFDQVILFAEDYNLYYEDSIYNHYVAATRAKDRLIIVYLGGSKDQNFYRNLSNRISDLNKKTEDFMKRNQNHF